MKKRRILVLLLTLGMILGMSVMMFAATTSPTIDGKSQWFIGETIDFGNSDVNYKSLSNTGEQITTSVSGFRILVYDTFYVPLQVQMFTFREVESKYGKGLKIQPNDSTSSSPARPTGIEVVSGEGSLVLPPT